MRVLAFAPAEDDKLCEPAQLLDAMPGVELGEIVVPEEVKEPRLRPARAGRLHGVDGEAGAAAGRFTRIQLEARFARDRRRHHRAAHLGQGGGGVELVRRNRRRDEDHAIQRELLDRIASKDQVPVVDGVEGTAEKGKTHGWGEVRNSNVEIRNKFEMNRRQELGKRSSACHSLFRMIAPKMFMSG